MAMTAIAIDHPKIWLSDTFDLDGMMENIKDHPNERSPAYQDGIFSYDENSFSIQLEKEIKTITWDDISLIIAYKVDQFAYDCIVIEIHWRETFISINDQTPGHMKFMESASNKLANFKHDWFPVVAFPAFETNLTTIYERQPTKENVGE
jgi:hypothetical protein